MAPTQRFPLARAFVVVHVVLLFIYIIIARAWKKIFALQRHGKKKYATLSKAWQFYNKNRLMLSSSHSCEERK